MPRDGDAFPRIPNAYIPTDQARQMVRKLAMLGVAQTAIAKKIGISINTLRLHFKDDLDGGDVEAFASVAGALWHNAVKCNNVVAQIFWMKARHGWVDRREVNHNHTLGPSLSHEERLAMLERDPPKELDHRGVPIIDAEVVKGEAEKAGDGEDEAG